MATTNRCYPPSGAGTTTTFDDPIAATGGNPPGIVSYTASANASVDAPYSSVPGLQQAGWQCPDALVGSGTTANRPGASGYKGKFYADTTLAAFIWSDGAIWRTFAGAAA
jgi:hypothetical protein